MFSLRKYKSLRLAIREYKRAAEHILSYDIQDAVVTSRQAGIIDAYKYFPQNQ